MKKQQVIILAGVAVTAAVFYGVNAFLVREVSLRGPGTAADIPDEAEVVVYERPAVSGRSVSGVLTRRMTQDPTRMFFLNQIFAGGVEAARFKSRGEVIFDVEGVIPDGEVSFENAALGTYGTEHFLDGQREGMYREYFSNGQLRFEKKYFQGRIVTLKEFFASGEIRMEIDYRDAMRIADDTETGRGRVFLKNGVMIYEWYLTQSDPSRYKKAYNHRGDLVETRYFDAGGTLTSQKRVPHD